jgi:anti-sigma factor RsiW
MTKRCLDEASLQAYIDGELSREKSAEAAAHLAACATCAAALAEAAAEVSFFANAFAPDEALSVPSEVLRSRINAAVAQLEPSTESRQRHSQGWSLGGLLASLTAPFSFTPQGAAAFAGLLALVALALIYFAAQRSQQTPGNPQGTQEVAKVEQTTAPQPELTRKNVEPEAGPTQGETAAGVVPVNDKHTQRRPAFKSAVRRPAAAPAESKDEALPGEREYQTAIASLEKTIKLGGDQSLRPALRVEYERNLALLDNAIGQTRRVAAENPKDKDAVGFLMAVYQSKVELLTKVADQAQVAALGR